MAAIRLEQVLVQLLGVQQCHRGKIKKIISDKGFGFIAADQGDLFFHHSEVKSGTFDQLQEGDLVEFTVGQARRARARQTCGASSSAAFARLHTARIPRRVPAFEVMNG